VAQTLWMARFVLNVSQGAPPPLALESIGEIDCDQDGVTCWTAYEMILPGLQVTLDMKEFSQRTGGIGLSRTPGFPTVASRLTYTTRAVIALLRQLGISLSVMHHPDQAVGGRTLLSRRYRNQTNGPCFKRGPFFLLSMLLSGIYGSVSRRIIAVVACCTSLVGAASNGPERTTSITLSMDSRNAASASVPF